MKLQTLREYLEVARKVSIAQANSPNVWRRHEKVLDQVHSKARMRKLACRRWKDDN